MEKKRYPRIKRAIYLKLLKKIKNIAEEINVPIKIYYRPIIWRRYGIFPNFGEHRGYYCIEDKKIVVTFYGNISYGRRLFLLLHELRHAIHHHEGLFEEFYDPKWLDLDSLLEMENPPLPCKRTGFLTELDCNRFAYYWLKREGIEIPKDLRYPPELSYLTQVHNIIKEKSF